MLRARPGDWERITGIVDPARGRIEQLQYTTKPAAHSRTTAARVAGGLNPWSAASATASGRTAATRVRTANAHRPFLPRRVLLAEVARRLGLAATLGPAARLACSNDR